MRLVAGDGRDWRLGRELAYALAWGAGVFLGVLGGALLTYTGAQGAPGASSLEVRDLVVAPLVAGCVMTAAHVLLSVVAGLVRGRRSGSAGAS
ncbi:MAG: hypothetical protein QMD76_08665 [Anaerosomatales bacterium]|nr:hypothetical protein [Anaerosomatales bacterium]